MCQTLRDLSLGNSILVARLFVPQLIKLVIQLVCVYKTMRVLGEP